MTIQLISNDAKLYRLCSEILGGTPELSSCTVSLISPQDPQHEADLHIWDFHPNLALPDDFISSPFRHLFLVDREDLASFYRCGGASNGSVLLKPVTRATLTTFLASVVWNGNATSLRADRDEFLQCLIQTNLKLQEYDLNRTTLLARAVHDFRAPLTALNGYCGLLLSEALGSLGQSQFEVLQRMQNSAKRLSRITSAMFDFSVGRQVGQCADLPPGDIRECVERALYEIAPFADEKSISITFDLEPSGELYFEAGRIEQVLVNILDNSCKFTPKAGSIEIHGYPFFWERRTICSNLPAGAERRQRAIDDPNSYRVDIGDSGAQIPNEHLHRIFEEYTSYAGGRDRSGGGLGLAICRMIITQHNGRVWAENRESGPVFSFVLPKGRFESASGDTAQIRAVANLGVRIHERQ